ncbi:MAG: DNA topoisomerase (ATP-hydrolyzing) subunit A [Oscillospiraceae bacterium]|nr:DNA topoisomerase (ATP-hydrolyzing) subunit A [Oscillospiraceae bacterium]
MPKKDVKKKSATAAPKAYIEGSGIVAMETITETLEKNYMPYAMSVIVSRALPEIDGFKPSHRKLLYTMYKMGLLNGARTKSANIVGQTMKLNPHGDAAIYETMVRLARGNESLLHPYVDSKGNFGKAYSRDMAYAASRYTEAKLTPLCAELFKDIDKDTVDFMPNYDNETVEPVLLPAAFPSVLVNANVGIAVSMASSVCPFNLEEVCETAIALIRNPEHNALTTLKAPDFPGGGFILYNEDELAQIYKTGKGSVKVRSRYSYDKEANCIEVTQIPPTTTVEAIIDKIVALVKEGKIREVSYVRDETDLGGLKLAIDIKRGTDPDALMKKLFRFTTLQDSWSCNFNILIAGNPRVMGVYEILEEWTAFRRECIKRRVYHELSKKKDKLHLLKALQKILLDIDKAIKIVRETDEDSEVVPNLMVGFGIDEVQAEYVAEIRLRHLNKEYILNRISEIEQLKKDIAEMEGILKDDKKVKNIIVAELREVIKKHAQPRKTMFLYDVDSTQDALEEETPDYPVHLFLSRSGYFKKITPQSLRMSGENKLKDGDVMETAIEASNRADLLFFTDRCQVYKAKASAFEDSKASLLGDFIPAKLSFDEGESVLAMVVTSDYGGHLVMVFENGKVAKVPLKAYETKTERKKLMNAYSSGSKLVKIIAVDEHEEILLRTTGSRALTFNTGMLLPKATRDTQGVQVFTLKPRTAVVSAYIVTSELSEAVKKYSVKNIPAAGFLAKTLPDLEQMLL